MGDHVSLAYDYPVLGAFWTVMWIFLWVVWLVLLFRVVTDIFRDHDLSGGAKTAWLVFVVCLPFLGVFVYVVSRGREMGTREAQHARAQQQGIDEYIRQTARGAAPRSEAEELAKLAEIHDRGAISDVEFERAKNKILH
ncbi:SHOCT domain-containing protein [Streptomyces sp.]|uniref:SHOCT domain-containing protein n=1 Tax=Streptomyces sp. TaxID=1931 RepID=UPI002F403030